MVYRLGGVEYETEVTFRTRIGPVSAEIPADADKFKAVESPDAIIAYERLIGLTLQATDISSTVQNSIVIAAGMIMQTEQDQIYRYGSGKDLAVQYDYDYVLTDLSGQYSPDTYTQQDIFKNGTYTVSSNGGAAQADRSVTATMMENYLVNILSQNFLVNRIPAGDHLYRRLWRGFLHSCLRRCVRRLQSAGQSGLCLPDGNCKLLCWY